MISMRKKGKVRGHEGLMPNITVFLLNVLEFKTDMIYTRKPK